MGCSKEAPHLSKETPWNPHGRELPTRTAGAGGEAHIPPCIRSLRTGLAAVGWGQSKALLSRDSRFSRGRQDTTLSRNTGKATDHAHPFIQLAFLSACWTPVPPWAPAGRQGPSLPAGSVEGGHEGVCGSGALPTKPRASFRPDSNSPVTREPAVLMGTGRGDRREGTWEFSHPPHAF